MPILKMIGKIVVSDARQLGDCLLEVTFWQGGEIGTIRSCGNPPICGKWITLN
jgi:hypothetical protein